MAHKILVIYREYGRVAPYAHSIQAVGVVPELVEVGKFYSLDRFSGVLLMGGTDVNPRLYGETPVPETDPSDDERDTFESDLIGQALDKNLPLFAICRGMQMLNVHLGGSLHQHVPSHRVITKENPGRPAHEVEIEPDTLLARIAGQKRWKVNSRHHQTVARIGNGLQASATSDQTVEALEMPGKRFVLGVQWHPEDQATSDPEQMKLFRAFANTLSE